MSSLDELQQTALRFISSGEPANAVPILRECLNLIGGQSGTRSLDYAQGMFSLALCMLRTNPSDLGEVHSLAREALNIRIAAKGRVDASVAICAEFLGGVCLQQTLLGEAESAFRLSLENAVGLVGPSHPNTAKAQYSLACVLLKMDRPTEAIPLAEPCMQTRRNVFGPQSAEAIASASLLAECYRKSGDLAAAESVLNEESPSEVPLHEAPFQNTMR